MDVLVEIVSYLSRGSLRAGKGCLWCYSEGEDDTVVGFQVRGVGRVG